MSCRDQGRRDDLWSLLYIVVELFNGNLPWRRLTRPDASPGHDNYDWDRMRDLKLACQREPQQMSPERPLPRVLESLTEKLRSTEYDQRPAYDAIRRLLQQGVEECADAGQQVRGGRMHSPPQRGFVSTPRAPSPACSPPLAGPPWAPAPIPAATRPSCARLGVPETLALPRFGPCARGGRR